MQSRIDRGLSSHEWDYVSSPTSLEALCDVIINSSVQLLALYSSTSKCPNSAGTPDIMNHPENGSIYICEPLRSFHLMEVHFSKYFRLHQGNAKANGSAHINRW